MAGATRLLLAKELRSMLREPIVLASILLPFIIYSSMTPFYQQIGEEARSAASLAGVRIVFADCGAGPALRALVSIAAERIASTTNATVEVTRGCDALKLLRQGYDVVVVFNGTLREPRVSIYLRGSLERLIKTLSLPQALSGHLGGALAGNVTAATYVYMNGRLYSFADLSSLFNAGTTLAYAALFILFPAAAAGAAMLGSEREERMLEVLLSLPVPRASIAAAKTLAVIVYAVLTAASATAGMLVAFTGMGVQVKITEYYGVAGLAVYAAALLAEALFVASLAMVVGLFSTTTRGAQAAASVVALPAIIPPLLILTGIKVSTVIEAVPYMAAVLAALQPLTGHGPAVASTVFQLVWSAAALAALARLLESEAAVTGPETLRRLLEKLRRPR